jgi:hypothetical protein
MSLLHRLYVLCTAFMITATSMLIAQDEFQWSVGGMAGGTLPVTEGDESQISFGVRTFLRHWPLRHASLEFGLGYLTYRDYQSAPVNLDVEGYVVPIELRIGIAPWRSTRFTPFIAVGGGLSFYRGDTARGNIGPGVPGSEYSGQFLHAVLAAGVNVRISKRIGLEFQIGNNVGPDDGLHPSLDNQGDGIWHGLAGIVIGIGPASPAEPTAEPSDSAWDEVALDADSDGDGLLDRDEVDVYGTDPTEPDSDGDGLSDFQELRETGTNPLSRDSDADGLDDGAELNEHKTDPLNADSDGDSLLDGTEVNEYRTNPLKADSDGDVLTDSEELLTYGTNPFKVDTDADGLTDGAEVRTWNSDPNNPDSDGDGLRDGQEVTRYKTSPVKADTDGGGESDGSEVHRGADPLDPADDAG